MKNDLIGCLALCLENINSDLNGPKKGEIFEITTCGNLSTKLDPNWIGFKLARYAPNYNSDIYENIRIGKTDHWRIDAFKIFPKGTKKETIEILYGNK